MQYQRVQHAYIGEHRAPDQGRRQLCAFAFMNFPSHDFPAEDIDNQTEVEEHACDGPRHPGYIPGPDLAGPTGLLAGWVFAPDRRLGPASVMLLSICAQDAIKAGLGCKISSLISQFGDDL
jgi:hypothetical protein